MNLLKRLIHWLHSHATPERCCVCGFQTSTAYVKYLRMHGDRRSKPHAFCVNCLGDMR